MGEYIQFPLVSNLGYVGEGLSELTDNILALRDSENEQITELKNRIINMEHAERNKIPIIFIQKDIKFDSVAIPFQLQVFSASYLTPSTDIPSGEDAKIDESKQTTHFRVSQSRCLCRITYQAFRTPGHEIKLAYSADGKMSLNKAVIDSNQSQIYLSDIVYFQPNTEFHISIESDYENNIEQGILMFEILYM